ncbi:MAG: hypothetical protein WD972_00480 [Candidatus Andersenbacteria bacterium]
MDESSAEPLQPDASELILCNDPQYTCETYIFEPTPNEASLGRLYAVAETEARGGVGTELLDLTIQALQREYYRDPTRGVIVSFESALHQANLVLHDTAEQGVRDWMGYFHVAIAVITGEDIHLSTAGNANITLVRRSQVSSVAEGLSHSPITNPLRTFAQVASGNLSPRDIIFLSSSHFPNIFRGDDLARFAIDHSASTISTRLQQLYTDKGSRLPLSLLTISLLPQHIAEPRQEKVPLMGQLRRTPREPHNNLTPRKPLIINRSWFKAVLLFIARIVATLWQRFKDTVWPLLVRGSQRSGSMVVNASKTSGQKVKAVTSTQLQRWRGGATTSGTGASTLIATPAALPLRRLPQFPRLSTLKQLPSAIVGRTRTFAQTMPRSSKVFAGITALLGVALVVSLLLLQNKRADDAAIQRAGELLQDARNHKQAAETALIYDNRDQARSLLQEADKKTQEVVATDLYKEESAQLKSEITTLSDRLQRIVRATTERTRVVGDFKDILEGTPTILSFVNNTIYTFNPTTNAVLSMNQEGIATVASETTQGIGFFTTATTHEADKTIVLATNNKGVALFDAKNNSLQSVDIELPSPETDLTSLATFGTRLYAFDPASKNILSFSKTLRGYAGGSTWITNAEFPKDNIKSLAVDGNIYTLHTDGSIRKLLKGEPTTFAQETVEPLLAGATKLIKTEDTEFIYILDVAHKRVVIYDEQGKLIRQVYVDVAAEFADVAVSPDETTLYVLDGTRVLAVSLAE